MIFDKMSTLRSNPVRVTDADFKIPSHLHATPAQIFSVLSVYFSRIFSFGLEADQMF
jgi:hypothetical protein